MDKTRPTIWRYNDRQCHLQKHIVVDGELIAIVVAIDDGQEITVHCDEKTNEFPKLTYEIIEN